MIGTVTQCVVCSAIYIRILDFTLFREIPEFYACYKLMNEKIIIFTVTNFSFAC